MSDSSKWKSSKKKYRKQHPIDVMPVNQVTSPLETIPVNISNEYHLEVTTENSFEEPFDINNPPDFSGIIDGQGTGDTFDFLSTYLNRALNIVFYPITAFRAGVKKASYEIGMVFSEGTMTQAHEECIHNFFSKIIAIAITIYMFYNWFFILYFHDDQVSKPLPDISWSALRDKSRFMSILLKYLVCQVSLLNTVVMKIRDYSKAINAQLFFIVLFLVMVTCLTSFGGKVMDLLQSAIDQKVDDTFSNGLIAYAFVFAAYSMAKEASEDSASFIAKFTSFIMVVGTFVLFVLRILVSISFIWVAALFIALYMIIYSFLGIKLFSKYGILETIHKINQFVVKGYEPPPPGKYDKCRPRKWIEFFVDTGKWLVNSVMRHFFELVIAYYLFLQIFNFQDCMSDNTVLRDRMMYVVIMMCIGLLGYVYSKIFPKTVAADQKVVAKVEKALGVEDGIAGGMEVPIQAPTETPIQNSTQGFIAEAPNEIPSEIPVQAPIQDSIVEAPAEIPVQIPPVKTIAEPPIQQSMQQVPQIKPLENI
jgi:hypothetical protein